MRGSSPVPSSAYDAAYFREQATGGDLFLSTRARLLLPKHYVLLSLADLRPGLRLLDLGCGRGEVTLHAALNGAEAHGLDYAVAALRLAQDLEQGLDVPVRARLRFLRADGKALPYADRCFDRIVSSEFAEHLHGWEFDRCLAECARLLDPRGHVVIHTAPNRLRYSVYYPLRSAISRLSGRGPVTADYEEDCELHPNEMSPFDLGRAMRPYFHVRVFTRSPRHFFASDLRGLVRQRNPLGPLRSKHLWAVGVPRGPNARRRLADVLRRVSAPRSELEMGTDEVARLGRGWGAPRLNGVVTREVTGLATVRLRGFRGARGVKVEYVCTGVDLGQLEVGVGRRTRSSVRVAVGRGSACVELEPGALDRRQVRLTLRTSPGLAIHAVRLVT